MNSKPLEAGAIWLRKEGDYAVVAFEHGGRWVEICREYIGGVFSHITEIAGIEARIAEQSKDERQDLAVCAEKHFEGRERGKRL
jgi:hypothetical protein